jgi:hypothetical protein
MPLALWILSLLCLTGTDALIQIMEYPTTKGVGALTSDGTYAFFAGSNGVSKKNLIDPAAPVIDSELNFSEVDSIIVDDVAVYVSAQRVGAYQWGIFRLNKDTLAQEAVYDLTSEQTHKAS